MSMKYADNLIVLNSSERWIVEMICKFFFFVGSRTITAREKKKMKKIRKEVANTQLA